MTGQRVPELDLAWFDDAACQGMPRAMFFPERGACDVAAAAIAVCDRCPVCQECLEFAVANRIRFGIWGGMSEKARRGMRTYRRAERPLPTVDEAIVASADRAWRRHHATWIPGWRREADRG